MYTCLFLYRRHRLISVVRKKGRFDGAASPLWGILRSRNAPTLDGNRIHAILRGGRWPRRPRSREEAFARKRYGKKWSYYSLRFASGVKKQGRPFRRKLPCFPAPREFSALTPTYAIFGAPHESLEGYGPFFRGIPDEILGRICPPWARYTSRN